MYDMSFADEATPLIASPGAKTFVNSRQSPIVIRVLLARSATEADGLASTKLHEVSVAVLTPSIFDSLILTLWIMAGDDVVFV
jgi:hypothetical protein